MVKTKRWRGAQPRVAIIGAGIGGLAVGASLARAGYQNFTIFEAEADLGGTWYVNQYPGAAVDTHSLLYQFSTKLHTWKSTHATQAELLEYLQEYANEHSLRQHTIFNITIDSVQWDEDLHQYHLTTDSGQVEQFDVVVSASGFLNVPRHPTWEGLETFRGPVLHTAEWDHSVELEGKTIAIAGVGSSSVQLVPALQGIAKKILVFQREPGWVLPQNVRQFSEKELEENARPGVLRRTRRKMILQTEWRFMYSPIYYAGSRRNKRAEATALAYLDRMFTDRPDLKAALTPHYAYSGKRRVLSDSFYPALLKDNVELVPHAINAVNETGPIDASGQAHEVDVLITATGFMATDYLSRLRVTGRRGRLIHDVWQGEPYALLGMNVPGFPNFYMIYGPNTNGAGGFSMNFKDEQQGARIVRELRLMSRRGFTALDWRPSVVKVYNNWLQRRLRRTAWSQANNYTKAASGKVVTQFAGSGAAFWLLHRVLPPLATFGHRRQPVSPSAAEVKPAISVEQEPDEQSPRRESSRRSTLRK